MTDIDFDELDRAVNSLMNKQQKQKAAEAAGAAHDDNSDISQEASSKQAAEEAEVASQDFGPVQEPSAPVPSEAAAPLNENGAQESEPNIELVSGQDAIEHLETDTVPQESTIAKSTPEVPVVTSETPTPESTKIHVSPMISRRPSGRFMDVVHPSSKLGAQRKTSLNSVRAGVFHQPEADGLNGEETQAATDTDSSSSSSVDMVSNNSIDIDNTKHEVESDVTSGVDSQREESNIFDEASSNKNSDDAMAQKIMTSLASGNSETSPLTAPFVSNVDVKKRPLGSTQVSAPDAAEDLASRDEVIATLESDLQADRTEEESAIVRTPQPLESVEEDEDDVTKGGIVGLPPEFDADVMAIEEADVIESSTRSLDAAVDDIKATEQSPDQSAVSHVAPDDDMERGEVSMFDTAVTPSTSSTPKEEKKSVWVTVLLVVLFLAIGVAGGAVAYFLLIK